MKIFLSVAIFVFIACFTGLYWIAGNLYLWNDSYTDLFVIITSYPPLSYLGIGNLFMVGVIDYIVVRDLIVQLKTKNKRNQKLFNEIIGGSNVNVDS